MMGSEIVVLVLQIKAAERAAFSICNEFRLI